MSLKGLEHRQRDPEMAKKILDAVPFEPTSTPDIVRTCGLHSSTVVQHLFTLRKQGKVRLEIIPGAGGGGGHKRRWTRIGTPEAARG